MRLPPRMEPAGRVQPPRAPGRRRGTRLLTRLVLLLGVSGALALPASVLAAGNGSGHSQTAMRGGPAAGHATVRGTNGAGDRDVRGTANDPSAPRHDHDNGIGNDCDPGLGGSNRDTGNDGRFGEGDSTCQRTNGQVSGTTTTGRHSAPNRGGGVESARGMHSNSNLGGGVEAAGTASSKPSLGGGVGAAGMTASTPNGGVAGAGSQVGSTLANGVGLAQTGSHLPMLGALGAFVLLLGALLLRRRRIAEVSA